jgi:hypothetical protein
MSRSPSPPTHSRQVATTAALRTSRFKNRSNFLEQAARAYLAKLVREEIDRRDLEIINAHADTLDEEALDVLSYQIEP